MSTTESAIQYKPTRRRFLQAAAGALAFPYIVPASALGADGHTAPSERITIGCIGVGNQGTGNMGAFLRTEGSQVVAVCDVDRSRRDRAQGQVNEFYENQDCHAYNDFREIIARDDIDAVSIGTPDHWHAIPTIRAAKAGKHIYCEKPLGLTVTEGRRMRDTVNKAGVAFQVGTWRRSRPAVRRACELIRNGYIGELHTMRIGIPEGFAVRGGEFSGAQPVMDVPDELDYEFWLGAAPWKPYTPGRCHFNFRWIMDYSEGYISDWGAHYYDIAQWANGTDDTTPVKVEGRAVFPPPDHTYNAPTSSHIVFTYANGVKLISEATADQSKWGMHFEGTEGRISTESTSLNSDPPEVADMELGPDDTRLYASDDHHANFIQCIKSGERTAAPIDVAHHSAAICHIGMTACLMGQPLDWDPKAERFAQEAANEYLSRHHREPWTLEG